MSSWQDFISGAVFTLFAVIAVFFLKFFVRTRDSFFLYFSVAFAALSVERMISVGAVLTEAQRPMLYLARFVAFTFIIWAIGRKNLESDRSPYQD